MRRVTLLIIITVFLVGAGCSSGKENVYVSETVNYAPRICEGNVENFSQWRVAHGEAMGQSVQLKENVTVDPEIAIDVKKKSDGYSGGTVESESTSYQYGSYRTVLKASGEPGTVTGFFTYAVDGTDVHEIDVEIYGDDPTRVNFVSRVGVKPNGDVDPAYQDDFWHDLGRDASQEFIEYGFDWYPDKVVFFVDGEHVGTLDVNDYGNNVVPNKPSQVIINGWVKKEGDSDYEAKVEVESVCYTPMNSNDEFAMECGAHYNPALLFIRNIDALEEEPDIFDDPRFADNLLNGQGLYPISFIRYGEYKVKIKTDSGGDYNWQSFGLFGDTPESYPVCSPLNDSFYNSSSIVMQISSVDTKLTVSSNFLDDTDIKYTEIDLGFNPDNDYHVYGFNWQSDRIEYFVDDKVVYTEKDVVPQEAAYFNIFGEVTDGPWDNITFESEVCEDGVVRHHTVNGEVYETNQYSDMLIKGICIDPLEKHEYIYYDAEGNLLDIN